MAHIDRCIPGTAVRIIKTGVPRVNGRTGTIVEVSRIQRLRTDPLVDRVTVEVDGHGDVVVAPGDLDIVDGD
jgi:hypothetical protein